MKTLLEIKKEYPTLTQNGWEYTSKRTGEKIGEGDIAKRPKEFKAICDFLNANIAHTKTFPKNISSYGYKHIVEDNIHHYVCNGMFIAAALACGYKMKYHSYMGPNCEFAMSWRSWKPFTKTRDGSGPCLDRDGD